MTCREDEKQRNRLKTIEYAKQMMKDGLPVEKIGKYTGLSDSEIKAL